MSKLLVIKSSPMGAQSVTLKLVTSFVEKYTEQHPETTVIDKNVLELNLPHLNDEIVGTYFTPADQHDDVQKVHSQRSLDLISEFKEVDAIVICAPMHNFSIPSALKAYIDHISRAGETFKYTETGPVGLLEDKPVYVISARGGDYSDTGYAQMDFVLPYMKTILGFMGIKDVTLIQANGMSGGDELAAKGVASALSQIETALAA